MRATGLEEVFGTCPICLCVFAVKIENLRRFRTPGAMPHKPVLSLCPVLTRLFPPLSSPRQCGLKLKALGVWSVAAEQHGN